MSIPKLVNTAFVCIITSVLILGSALGQSPERKIDDREITRAIEKRLLVNDEVSSHLIDVNTDKSVVKLSGFADNLLARERAVEIAQSTKGVISVINNIKVRPISRSDEVIRRDVLEALENDQATELFDVDVKVDGGVVALSGNVDSYAEKELCAEVVKSIKGIRDIKNNIEVSLDEKRSDYEIETEIEGRLESDVRIDSRLIEVEVQNGVVTLKGTVGSAVEKQQAEMDARISGVKSVENGLEVQWWARNRMRSKEEDVELTDREVRDAVLKAFSYDPRVLPFEFSVEVEDGVVILSGTVNNLKAKRAAERDAKNTEGVWRVKNLLKVRPEGDYTDKEIAENVREALSRDTFVNRYDINVSVYNSKVFLTGKVDTYFEKSQAEDVATKVKGVVEVENNLTFNQQQEWRIKTDWEIENDIESYLSWNPYIEEDIDQIKVTVEDNVATLKGTVDSWFEFNIATDIAFQAGAQSVVNELNVKHGPDYYKP